MAELTGSTLNYNKTILTAEFPKNTGTTENEYQVQVSGTSTVDASTVLSNTARIIQSPSGKIEFSVNPFNAPSGSTQVENIVRLILTNVSPDKVQIESWNDSFIVAPRIDCVNDVCYLNFYIRPNTTTSPRTSQIVVSGEDVYGHPVSGTMQINQGAGVAADIVISDSERVVTDSTRSVVFYYEIINGNIVDGTIGVASKSQNLRSSDIVVDEDAMTVTLAIPENQSYLSESEYYFSLSGVTAFNGYEESNTATVTQSPKSGNGFIRLYSDANEVSYAAGTATFRITSNDVTNIQPYPGGMEYCHDATIFGDILTVHYDDNPSFTATRTIQVAVSGTSSNGVEVFAFATTKQKKKPGLFIGSTPTDAQTRMDAYEPQTTAFETTARWYNSYLNLNYLAPNVSNLRYTTSTADVSADIITSTGVITVRFSQNMAETPRTIEITFSGTSETGEAISKTCQIVQEKCEEGSILISYEGSTSSCMVDASTTALTLDYSAAGVESLTFSASTNSSVATISMSQMGDTTFSVTFTQNTSYTQQYTYSILLYGVNGNQDVIASNVFTINQQKAATPDAKLIWGTGDCPASTEEYTVTVSSETDQCLVDFDFENVTPSSIYSSVDPSSPDTDFEITLDTATKKATVTFPAYPGTQKKYLINLYGENLAGEQYPACNVLSIIHQAAPAATLEGEFNGGTTALTISCEATAVTATYTATTIDPAQRLELSSDVYTFEIGEWQSIGGGGAYTVECVVAVPANTKYLEPGGPDSDTYEIESSVVSVAGVPAVGNTLTITQARCKTPPYVRISLTKVNGQDISEPTIIPYGSDTVTWLLEANNIEVGTERISLPAASFIKDTDGTTNTSEVWTGESVSNLYKKYKIWKESAEPQAGDSDTGWAYVESHSGTVENVVTVSGTGVDYGTLVASTRVTGTSISDAQVHAPAAGGKIVLQYEGDIPAAYTIQTGGTIGFCTSVSVDTQNRKITLYYSANTGTTTPELTLRLTGDGFETNQLVIVHDRQPEPTINAWWSGTSSTSKTVECTDTSLTLLVSGVSLNQNMRPVIATTGCTANAGDWFNGVSSCSVTFPENTRYIDGGVTGDTYTLNVSAYDVFGNIITFQQDVTVIQKRCRTLPTVSIALTKIDSASATSADIIPYSANRVTWGVTTNNITVGSSAIRLPASDSFIRNTDGATNTQETGTFESISDLVKFEKLWKSSTNPADGHNDTGATYIESHTATTENTVSVSAQGVNYGSVSGSVTVTREKYADATVYAPSTGGTLILEYSNASGGLGDVTIKTGGTPCQNVTVDTYVQKVYLTYAENTTSGNKTLTIYLKSDTCETNRLIVVQEPKAFVNIALSEIDGQAYTSGPIPYIASSVTWTVETNTIAVGTASVVLPSAESFILNTDGASNTVENGTFESDSDLYLFEKLWKSGSTPSMQSQDTGVTYLDNYSGSTTNTVYVTGTSVSGGNVTGSTEVSRMFYNPATVYAPADGGVVTLSYSNDVVSTTPVAVTGGTGCSSVQINESTRRVDLTFTRNDGDDSREFTIYLNFPSSGARTNTLKVVQEEAPNIHLSFDNVATVMYSEDLIARTVTTTYWKVRYRGITPNTIGVDLAHSEYIQGGSGIADTPSGDIQFIASLTGANNTRTNRTITLTVTGTSIYGETLSATATARQVGIIDLKMFSPVNVRAEGEIIYVSIATTNVEIDSVVCDNPDIASGMSLVSGTSSVSDTGLTIYSVDVPSNLSCWADENPVEPGQAQITASKEGYVDSKFVISCGDNKEVSMFNTADQGLRVFTITANGHDSEDNAYIDYVVVVQRDTPEKAAVVVCGDTRYSSVTATTLSAGTIRVNNIVVGGSTTLSCPTTICDTVRVDNGEVEIDGNLNVDGDVGSTNGFWQTGE